MIVLNAQQLQRLAESFMRLDRLLEAQGGEAGTIHEDLHELAARLRVDLDMVRIATPDTLESVLGPGMSNDPGRRWAMAETLYLDGVLARAEGREEAMLDRHEKARRLFRSLVEGGEASGLKLPEGQPFPEERLKAMGPRNR